MHTKTEEKKRKLKKKIEVGIIRRGGAVVRNVYYVYLITLIRRGRGVGGRLRDKRGK